MVAAYIPSAAGFHVLFQDVDLVWLQDPIDYLHQIDADMAFMDDGARGTRYAPLFTNSGFYFVKYTPKSLYFQELMLKNAAAEIGTFHSHQAVLTKHLLEAMYLGNLKVHVLDKYLFPSGKLYHDERQYIVKILNHDIRPYVFHMCWTTNKIEKIEYFDNMNLWYLPQDNIQCTNPSQLLDFKTRNILDCCKADLFWGNFKATPDKKHITKLRAYYAKYGLTIKE
jgi:hypothetical protein